MQVRPQVLARVPALSTPRPPRATGLVGAAALGVWLAIAPGVLAAAQPPSPAIAVTHVARALQPGEIVELIVNADGPLESVEAAWRDRVATLWPDAARTHWRGLIGLDVELAPGTHVVTLRATTAGGPPASQAYPLLVAPKTFRERHLRVDPRFSDPPASVRPRIAREAAQLERLFGTVSRREVPDVPLARPVSEPPNSSFGVRSFFNKLARGRHNGVDFASPSGTEIRAPGRGRVVLVEDLYFTGHTVVIDHGYGLYTLFAHLERATTAAGRELARGEVLGLVGATGRATGPHLHWSMRLLGTRVDPLSLTADGQP